MNLTPTRVGTRYFDERPVTATDPCYNHTVWCRMDGIKIKPGEYTCLAWKSNHYYTDKITNKRHYYKRVHICGIYLNGEIPHYKKGEEIGEIGVDAGMAGFFQDKPDYDDDGWYNICNLMGGNNDAALVDEGFFTSSGYGDGCYPVYAFKNEDGEIVALEIHF